jgi:hypothetical protein
MWEIGSYPITQLGLNRPAIVAFTSEGTGAFLSCVQSVDVGASRDVYYVVPLST